MKNPIAVTEYQLDDGTECELLADSAHHIVELEDGGAPRDPANLTRFAAHTTQSSTHRDQGQGGTPLLPPVTKHVPLDLIETRTFGSRVIYERYGRARDESD